MFVPWNWRFAFARANVLAKEIASGWNISATLRSVPATPTWSINGTTAETGRRFRFKDHECGDRMLGYASVPDFPVAMAMAMSAAFPGGIGPLALDCRELSWYQHLFTSGTAVRGNDVQPSHNKVHLYDGGLYDNLGLEPLFDLAKQRTRSKDVGLVVSDAGAPFRDEPLKGSLNPMRINRWLDVTTDQQRALRVRTFVHALKSRSVRGAYLQIGTSAVRKLRDYATHLPVTKTDWLKDEDAESVALIPTSLNRLAPESFDHICRHGYETARWNNLAFPYC